MSQSTTVVRSVAEEIYQLRLPLPFALNHVNAYLLHDDDGWTILDGGLHAPEVIAGWQVAFDELGVAVTDIRRIVLTHMHPDHFGLSGWLQEQSAAPVFMSPRECELAHQVWIDQPDPIRRSQVIQSYLRSAGAPADVGATIERQEVRLRQLTLPHPREIRLLQPGSEIFMAGRAWRMLHAPGHSDGQLLFYSPTDRLLLSGDQVLLKITPNVGFWPTSQPNPLARYLASLTELARLDVALALPGHHGLIHDWPGRIAELLVHHEERLGVMFQAAGDGASALEVSLAVFNFDRFSPHEMRFAVAETLAHLEYLAEEGRLERVEEPERRIYRQPINSSNRAT
jgi:glyoxylase-like metal-dependent hydrolase (beta-lactamase superfamily II)